MEKKKNGRVKREDCSRTKHDSLFSHWKILVGPDDWYEHSYNKIGAQRYRTHNLPDNFPGLYELGVTKSYKGTKTRMHDIDDVIVVYLGQADNVRTRLQHYGRTGSHLECPKWDPVSGKPGIEIPVIKEGPGLFKEIFAKGCSVVYRCAKMKSKLEAERREEQLLGYFDFAWNQIHNGFCRRNEILLRIQNSPSDKNPSILKKLQNLKKILFYEKTPGVRIDRTISLDKYLIPDVRKFGGNRPQLVKTENDVNLHKTPLGGNICGIVLGEAGVCVRKPVEGKKRCEEHKGRRIVETKIERFVRSDGNGPNGRKIEAEIGGSICGASDFDGSICKNEPVKGRKRCAMHKGKREAGKQVIVTVC